MDILKKRWVPSTISGAAIVAVGYVVLIWGIFQIPVYLGGITPKEGSQAVAVSAEPLFGLIQVGVALITIAMIVLLTKYPNKWLKPVGLVVFLVAFFYEAGMAIGYTGL
jgi:hypothetical protein